MFFNCSGSVLLTIVFKIDVFVLMKIFHFKRCDNIFQNFLIYVSYGTLADSTVCHTHSWSSAVVTWFSLKHHDICNLAGCQALRFTICKKVDFK